MSPTGQDLHHTREGVKDGDIDELSGLEEQVGHSLQSVDRSGVDRQLAPRNQPRDNKLQNFLQIQISSQDNMRELYFALCKSECLRRRHYRGCFDALLV